MSAFLTLRNDPASLALAPAMGGGIAYWRHDGVDLLRPLATAAPQGPRDLGCYPLFPFSNRVAGRRFTFAGQSYELPALLGGFAIHGAAWQLAWQGSTHGNTAHLMVEHRPGPLWPFAFRAEQRFTLEAEALICDLAITNQHDASAPAGFGLHPYFPRHPGTRLQLAARTVWHNGADMIPTHRSDVPEPWDFADGRALDDVVVDNCFADWPGTARLSHPARDRLTQGHAVTIRADAIFRHVVIFVPESKDFCAVEPVTNMNDGLNRMNAAGHGMVVLAPGETSSGRITFRREAA
ncbi:MAG: aldose 1-epimerase [Rhodospirillales bacterium]|nr:aldose 1-epimerase [Rhodospirillales bacterium]